MRNLARESLDEDKVTVQQPRHGSTPVAPTWAEFKAQRARAIRALLRVRKASPPKGVTLSLGDDVSHLSKKEKREKQGKGKGGIRKIWTFTHEAQGVMCVTRAYWQFEIIHIAPWVQQEEERFQRAVQFAKEVVPHLDVDTICDEDFFRTMKKTIGQLRTAGQDDMKAEVTVRLEVEEGEAWKAEHLLEDDRFLYPKQNMIPKDYMKIELISSTLVRMFFGSNRQIGNLLFDRQFKPDDPDVLAELFEHVTEEPVGMGDLVEPIQIVDPSPEASYGPSLAAIAFAAVNIRHALERLKAPPKPKVDNLDDLETEKNKKKGKKGTKNKEKKKKAPKESVCRVEFTEDAYGDHWARYVRELAKHPHLGVLRQRLLKDLKM
ncbi:hypothetical protein FRC09_012716 [Ceratobasidium sp. 395]|nr:hypothetical protein FRC09_012716 [Ceratobasidium sp. 395]